MLRKLSITFTGLFLLVALLVSGFGFAQSVSAQVTEGEEGEVTSAERAENRQARKELRQVARQVIDKEELKQVVADTLGVTVEEVEAARENGTMQELIDASGVSAEELEAAVTAARDAMIDEALANGEITAEQAEQLKARDGSHKGEGPDGPGSREGREGRGAGDGPQAETTDEA